MGEFCNFPSPLLFRNLRSGRVSPEMDVSTGQHEAQQQIASTIFPSCTFHIPSMYYAPKIAENKLAWLFAYLSTPLGGKGGLNCH